ncbi:hypothetical protein, unknown function [Leishmania tarentolae]|uniref:Uncharacterized protein n=1 Tax=Leishmania tarentolae TaxID=5689 RepID=A0A640KKB7_LEITA|nr:hypothetical protein, unknown function [Leishmania tarentolae]
MSTPSPFSLRSLSLFPSPFGRALGSPSCSRTYIHGYGPTYTRLCAIRCLCWTLLSSLGRLFPCTLLPSLSLSCLCTFTDFIRCSPTNTPPHRWHHPELLYETFRTASSGFSSSFFDPSPPPPRVWWRVHACVHLIVLFGSLPVSLLSALPRLLPSLVMNDDDPSVVSSSAAFAGGAGLPCVCKTSEVLHTSLPSPMLLNGNLPQARDISQDGGCAKRAFTAVSTAGVPVASTAPQSTTAQSSGRDDSVVLSRNEDGRGEVDIAFVNASLKPLAQAPSEGELEKCDGNKAVSDMPFRGRDTWTPQTTMEPPQRDSGILCVAEVLHLSPTPGADKGNLHCAMASASPLHGHLVTNKAAAAATAAHVREPPAIPPLSPEVACDPCDHMDSPLRSRREGHFYASMESPGLGGSGGLQTLSAASSAYSVPHSTAETQWRNTSETSELDFHEIPLPVMDTATDHLAAVSSVFCGDASPVAIKAGTGEPVRTANTGADVWSSISVSALMSPNRQHIPGFLQSSKPSGWRSELSSDTSAVRSERNSDFYGNGGDDILPVSLETAVTWSSEKPIDEAPSSPVVSFSQKRIESLDETTGTSTLAQVTTETALAAMESGSAPNPVSTHSSPRLVDLHHARQRRAPIRRVCVSCREMAPSLHSPMSIRPGGVVVASTHLGVSVRSPLETVTSTMRPMFMNGSTASRFTSPRSDTAFPLCATIDTLTKSASDESQQPLPQFHDEEDGGNTDRPSLTPTSTAVTLAVQHLSSSIEAARRKSTVNDFVTPSRQQGQQQPFRQSTHEEESTTENGSSKSISAPPQQNFFNFTVTSATSFCVDNAATVCDLRSKTAESSSPHGSTISMRQSSTLSENQILQTLAHGMALGGVLTSAWKAAQDNSTPASLKLCTSDPGNRHLTGKPVAPQNPLPPPWHSVASDRRNADRGTQRSPMSFITYPSDSSPMPPHMHRSDMSLYLGSHTQTPRSQGKSPTAGLVAPPTRFSELQMQRGKLRKMNPTRPAGTPATSEADRHREIGSQSPAHDSPAVILSSPSRRHRRLPNPDYWCAAAEEPLRDAGGSRATALPTMLCSALYAERSLCTPVRGYSLTQRSSAPSVASLVLSQGPFGREGVIFSASSTPNVVGCVEAGVTAWLPVVSSGIAERQLSDGRAVLRRPNDSNTTHYHMPSNDVFSIVDSGVAVGAPMEVFREERFTFLQSVQDVGGLAAQTETGIFLGNADAVQCLLGEEITEPAAMDTATVPQPTPMPSAAPTPLPTVGFVSGWVQRTPAGGGSTAFSLNTACTAAPSPARKTEVSPGNSSELHDGACERISAQRMAAEPIRVVNDKVTMASLTPMVGASPVCRSPPPAPATLPRPALTRKTSYPMPRFEVTSASELRHTSFLPCTSTSWAIGDASDLEAATATPPLSEMVRLKDNVNRQPRVSKGCVFQPVLPLAKEENAATSLSDERGTPKTMCSTPEEQLRDESVAATNKQQLRRAPAVARVGVLFRATGTDTCSTSLQRESGESGMHFDEQSLKCSSPSGLLPRGQQNTPQLQRCSSASTQPSLYRVHNKDDQSDYHIADCNRSRRAGVIRGSLRGPSSGFVELTAGVDSSDGDGHNQSCRAQREPLFHQRGTLTGRRDPCCKKGGKEGGDTGSPLRIPIPRFQRYCDVEALLEESERAMNRAAVPIISLLGCGGSSSKEEDHSLDLLGNAQVSSVMSLATPAPTSLNTGMGIGLVSPLTLASASVPPVSSPPGTMSSFPFSAPSER